MKFGFERKYSDVFMTGIWRSMLDTATACLTVACQGRYPWIWFPQTSACRTACSTSFRTAAGRRSRALKEWHQKMRTATQPANIPAAGKAEIALLFAFGYHRLG